MVNLLKKSPTEHNLLVYCVLLLNGSSCGAIFRLPKKIFCFHDTALRAAVVESGMKFEVFLIKIF